MSKCRRRYIHTRWRDENAWIFPKMKRDFIIFGIAMSGIGMGIWWYENQNAGEAKRVKALLEMARESARSQKFRNSLLLYKQALVIVEREDSHMGAAKILSDMGDVRMQRAEYDAAIEDYEAALEHLEYVEGWKTSATRGAIAPLSGAVWSAIATALAEKAGKMERVGRYDIEHLYVRALSLTLTKAQFVRALDTRKDDNGAAPSGAAVAASTQLQAACGILYNLACFYVQHSRFNDANATLQRALRLSELSGEFVDGRADMIRELLEKTSSASEGISIQSDHSAGE